MRSYTFLYDRMTVHGNRFLVNETNRCTEFQFYWYYDSTCFGQLSAHHQEFLAVHRLWYILCSCDDRLLPGAGWHRVLRRTLMYCPK